MNRRVVVTGIGMITPMGIGADENWCTLRARQSRVRAAETLDVTPFKSRVAAEITGFEPLDYMQPKRVKRLDRFSQLSIASSRMAMDSAGICLDQVNTREFGVYLGSALGGVAYAEEQHLRYFEGGLRAVDPSVALSVFGGAGSTNVAIEFGLKGPSMGNSNSCASGANAIGESFRMIKRGEIDIMLAGGVETPLTPMIFSAFSLIRALSTRNDDPSTASRPFDKGRNGFVMSEGAAMLVLESYEHAVNRGQQPIAEITGYGATNDAYHMMAPRPDGGEVARAMTLAMREAEITPSDIGYLNTHSTSTPLGDTAEAKAVVTALGDATSGIPTSGTKGYYGHPLGASGAIEAGICSMVIERGWMPPSLNLESTNIEEDLCFITGKGLERQVDIVMSNALGFGGINTSTIFRRCSV
jgi:3-oxoacyl-[acyl-carrier-protein] synthase II